VLEVGDQDTTKLFDVTELVLGDGVPGGDGTVAEPEAVPDCLDNIDPFAVD
jgi:hypothetical protein